MNPIAALRLLARGRGGAPRLAPEITAVLLVKALVLALLWALFVRGHEARVDGAQTAASFGFAGPKTSSTTTTQGGTHGQ